MRQCGLFMSSLGDNFLRSWFRKWVITDTARGVSLFNYGDIFRPRVRIKRNMPTVKIAYPPLIPMCFPNRHEMYEFLATTLDRWICRSYVISGVIPSFAHISNIRDFHSRDAKHTMCFSVILFTHSGVVRAFEYSTGSLTFFLVLFL